MGIVITPSVSNLETRVYLAGKRLEIQARAHPIIDASACNFDLFNCCWPIPQFADLSDTTDKYKNDSFYHIFERDPGQTSVTTITNNSTEQSVTFTDDTYGKFYDFGTWVDRPDVSGWEIKWFKVAQLLGFGSYTVTQQIYDGTPTLIATKLDLCFELIPFSCDAAHGTIRFETNQTGYIHNGFDYRDLDTVVTANGSEMLLSSSGWIQQIRWYGIMYPDIPDEQSDFIQMSERVETQIQQKKTDKYKIELHLLRSDFGNHLLNDNFLATEIYVSDFNLNNFEVYRDKFLRKVSTDQMGVNRMNTGVNVTLTFKEMDEGTVKRVYG